MGSRSKLIQKRLEMYPAVYEVIAPISMRTRRIAAGSTTEALTVAELQTFHGDYLNINVKVGVLFSSHAAHCSWELREFVFERLRTIAGSNNPTALVLDADFLDAFGDLIRKLEVALKQDLGVFLDEFGNRRAGRHFETYSDLQGMREEFNRRGN